MAKRSSHKGSLKDLTRIDRSEVSVKGWDSPLIPEIKFTIVRLDLKLKESLLLMNILNRSSNAVINTSL